MKYLVYYTKGDFTGTNDYHKIIDADTPQEALKIILKELDEELGMIGAGFAPYYENVRVYEATSCLAEFKGKDKNGEFK